MTGDGDGGRRVVRGVYWWYYIRARTGFMIKGDNNDDDVTRTRTRTNDVGSTLSPMTTNNQ